MTGNPLHIRHLIAAEIRHRALHAGLTLVSIAAAVASLVGAQTALRAHDIRTEEIIAAKEEQTRVQMAELEDDYRKIMKELGFNVLILPHDQDLGDLYADQHASAFMSESYVDTLANSGLMTIRHLLPNLQQKVLWPERRRTIILTGVRGEVPLVHRNPLEPILLPVAPGAAVLGHELHHSLGLSEGDRIELLGRTFTVSTCNPERGNRDDITIWIDLQASQELLDKPGLITGIHALKCHCYGERLGVIRGAIERLLPDTRVIEFASEIITRAEARDRAADMAREALAAERSSRVQLRTEREAFAAVLVPLVILASGVWIGSLGWLNARERRGEVGMLRAIGVGTRGILQLFLGRALILGCVGALAGYAVGFAGGMTWGEVRDPIQLFSVPVLVTGLAMAPFLSCIASWIPALMASQQDPADILREP